MASAQTQSNAGNKTPKRDRQSRRPTKKSQILSLYSSGVTDLHELAHLTDSKATYVASVLQESGLLSGYFDLYTHSSHPMNVYSQFFSGKLGFKDEETARASVELLERFYNEFSQEKDRAGQHHALTVALTMYDRARWCSKRREAEHFRQWLLKRLGEKEQMAPPSASELPRH